jgi:hypothetical protein
MSLGYTPRHPLDFGLWLTQFHLVFPPPFLFTPSTVSKCSHQEGLNYFRCGGRESVTRCCNVDFPAGPVSSCPSLACVSDNSSLKATCF